MRLFYKSHGKHCYLRSFPTKCTYCGEDVLYWECRHGSKVFFNYPIYGKLIRHRCIKPKSKNFIKKYHVIVKSPEELFPKASFHCPICGKIFKNEQDMKSHIEHSQKNDSFYKEFDAKNRGLKNNPSKVIAEQKRKVERKYQPKFGQINIKK